MFYLLLYYSLRFLIIVYFLRRFCFWSYFWQLKQYRWRRVREEISRNKKIIPWEIALVSIGLLSLSFGFPYAFHLLTPWYFAILGTYAVVKIFQGKWSLPQKFTPKIILILGLAIFSTAPLFLLNNTQQFQSFLILDIVLPIVFSFIIKIVEIPTFFVKQSILRKAKAKIEKEKNLMVIGITGSYGKTSVKKFLTILLNCRYGKEKVLATPKNVNTELGVAQLILKSLKKKDKFFVCEMGAYHRKEISRMAQLVKPQMGILTGINEQHLALFGSLKNTLRAKQELIESLPTNGWALFNGDDARVLEVYKKTKIKKAYVSTLKSRKEGKLIAKNIEVFKDHLSFTVTDHQESIFLNLPLIGRSNVVNILLASSAALFLGFSLPEIQKCFSASSFPTFQRLKHDKQFDVLLSTYSTNPNGFLANLQHLKLWSGQRIVVTPGIIELGEKAHVIHYQLGQSLAEIADMVILTKDYYLADIQKGMSENPTKHQTQLFYLPSSQEVLEKIKKVARPQSVILLEGRVPAFITKNL